MLKKIKLIHYFRVKEIIKKWYKTWKNSIWIRKISDKMTELKEFEILKNHFRNKF